MVCSYFKTWLVLFYVPLMTHPGVNQQSTSLEHLLMLFFEQNLFILNANRAGLGSHSKWTNFVQKTTCGEARSTLVTFFNKRHYEVRFHRIVKINSKNKSKNQCGGGGNKLPRPQLWFLQLLKVEFKMNNFRSNLGGAPAKKNGTWGLFGLDHVWTMFVFFYVPLMTHPGVNQQSTSLEHILTLVSWTNFVHFDCEPGRPRFAFKMNKICSKNNMRRSPV